MDDANDQTARVDGVDGNRRHDHHHAAAQDAQTDGGETGCRDDDSMERMLAALPGRSRYPRAALRDCIAATQECAQACTACADACLGEEMVAELADCVRVLLTTADVCAVTARVLSRPAQPDHTLTPALLSLCWAACRRAREVCEEFLPIHHYCRVCARACRAAELSCQALLAAVRGDDAVAAGRQEVRR